MITISEIAKIANVSKSTVSNAFNNPQALSSATRDHIFKICQDVGYRLEYFQEDSNQDQQTLVEFNIVTSGKISYFTQKIIAGLIEEAAVNNAQILVTLRDKPLTGQNNSDSPIQGRILAHTQIKDQLTDHIPTVLIGKTQNTSSYISQINNHNIDLIHEATELLIDLGHQHILFLNTSQTQTVAHERLKGFKECLANHHIVYTPANHHMCTTWQDPDEYVYRLIHSKPYLLDNMTAIICDSTKMTQGVYKALHELHIRIPEQISVISICRNSDTHLFDPPISHFDLRPHMIGKAALRQTLAMIEGEAARKIYIDHHFISGGSLGYPTDQTLQF